MLAKFLCHTIAASFSLVLVGTVFSAPMDLVSPALAQPNEILSHSFNPGTTSSFSIEYHNNSHSNLHPLMDDATQPAPAGDQTKPSTTGLERTVQASIHGTCEMIDLGSENGDLLVHFRMPGARIVLIVDGQPASEEIRQISGVLAKGFVFSRSPSGNIRNIWLDSTAGSVAQGSIKILLALTQVVFSEQTQQEIKFWDVAEQDQTGSYQVRYTREDDAGALAVFRKQKQLYLPIKEKKRASRQLMPASYKPQGSMRIEFEAAKGRLHSISGTDSHDIIIGDKTAGRSETTFSMVFLQGSKLTPKALSARLEKHRKSLSKLASTPLLSSLSSNEANALLYRQKLGTATLASLRAELAVAEKSKRSKSDQTELYQKLKALVFLQPQSCQKLVRDLAGKPLDSLSFKMVTGALAAIASPIAQDAIVSLIKARQKEPETVVQLIPVLGMLEEPTLASENVIKELAYQNSNDDIATTAQLALSIMARTLSYDDQGRAYEIMEEFMGRHGNPQGVDDIHKLLLVLGNAAMEKYLPRLLTYADDPDGEIRSDAVFALRFYPAEKVDSVLIRAVTSDRDATTRREAASALGYMDANDKIVAALIGVYGAEKIPDIRLDALESLWKWEKSYPEVRRLIRHAAESDESEDLRKSVKGLMSAYPDEYFR